MPYDVAMPMERMLRELHHDPEVALAAGQALVLLCALEEQRFTGKPSSQRPLQATFDGPKEALLAELDERLAALTGRSEQLCDALSGLSFQGLEPDAVLKAAKSAQRAVGATEAPGRTTCDLFGELLAVSGQLRPGLGQYFTPAHVAQASAAIIEPSPGEWLLEPSCGSGVMMLAAVDALRERHGLEVSRALTLVGIDIDSRSVRACIFNLAVHDMLDQSVVFHGDSLVQEVVAPDSNQDGELHPVVFSCVLSNPPFGAKAKIRTDSLVARDPLVIPDRLLNRPILVPA